MKLLAALAIVCSAGLGIADVAANEVVVGAYLPMTGATASFGIAANEGIQLAIDEHNAKTIGPRVRGVTLDTAGKASEVPIVVERLADQGAIALIGDVTSSGTLAGGKVAQQRGIPMVTPAATHPDITKVGSMISRVVALDEDQAFAMAKFARSKLQLLRIATLVDSSQTYSTNLGTAFSRDFTVQGGVIIAAETYTSGAIDFKTQLEAIAKTRAQAIYIPGYYNDVAVIAKQARAMKIGLPLLGADGWDSPDLHKLAGEVIEGSFHTNHFAVTDARAKAFVAAYRKKYSRAPDALAALGYDAARVVLAAIDRSKTRSAADVATAIRATSNVEGVTGKLSIDPKTGNAKKSIAILEITDAAPRVVGSISR